MALTLQEAAYRSNDILQIGIIEKLVYDDPILMRLPFKDIVGNGLTYDVEATMSTANWYGVNETWTESTSTVDQTTAVTHILGGDADVDNFLQATRSNLQDLMTEQITAKVKAIKKSYMEMFWYGYYYAGSGGDAKGFDGLHYLIRSYQTNPYVNSFAVNDSSTGNPNPAATTELEEAVDAVKNGKPDLMVMTKQCRRNLNAYLNGTGGITKEVLEGRTVQTMFEVPIGISDYLSDDESCDSVLYLGGDYGHDYTDGTALANGDSSTTVFVLRFGPEAVCGIQSMPITTVPLGSLETKDATRVRIKWYPGLMLQSIITASKYSGISNATWTVS